MVSDKNLQDDVLAELEFEPSVNPAHIGIAAKDGVITRTGRVGSFEHMLAAERAVRRVRGIRAVGQEVEVRLPSDKKRVDDQIAERAENILSSDQNLPLNRVYARVDHGLVMLHGSVEMPFQVEEAERQVRKLSGVGGAVNEICVRPRQVPIDIARRIEAALPRSAEIGTGNRRVRCEYGKVTRMGAVDNCHQPEAAEPIARSVRGVNVVENQLVSELQP